MACDIREEVRNIFYRHLKMIYNEVCQKGVISADEIKCELLKRTAREEKLDKRYKIPLIGKIIMSYSIDRMSYQTNSTMYKAMLTLVEGCKLNALNKKTMEYIITNQEEIYDKFFREDYEELHRVKELSSETNGLEK